MFDLRLALQPARRTRVTDIGANPIDGEPPYKSMLAQGMCDVIGFEPQPEALARLNAAKSALETYRPEAIGDGGIHTLHHCVAEGMTSLLPPDQKALSAFARFADLGKVTATSSIRTARLDDVLAPDSIDLLKIDIQGAERMAMEHGAMALARAVAVHIEVSFTALYEGQPTFGEIDVFMRERGFIPATFAAVKQWPLTGARSEPPQHLLEADVLYVRDHVHGSLDVEQWKQLALIAHHCYAMHDLTARCLTMLADQGAIADAIVEDYRLSLVSAPRPVVQPEGQQRHVWIAIPAYTGQIHLGTMRSIIADMLAFADRGDRVTIFDESGNAMIGDCRGLIVAKFLESDGTDLIFIDSDVAWEAGGLLRLVDYPVDFVAGVYPQRKDPINFCIQWIQERKELWANPETGLLEVAGVPAGCMRLSRTMLERMVAAYPETAFFCADAKDNTVWDLFGAYRDPADQRVKYGEDYSFCRRWRDLGGKIWVAPEMRLGHVGFKTFVGSLGDWLRANNMPQQSAEQALAEFDQSIAALENALNHKKDAA